MSLTEETAAEILESDPTVHPCDRCEKLVPASWFGSFWLCADCVLAVTETVGKQAAGRAIERLAQSYHLRVDLRARLKEREKAIYDLLLRVGEPALCRGCQAAIVWVEHRPRPGQLKAAKAPYNPDGVSHFATCPKARDFKKVKHGQQGTGTAA